VRLAVDLCRHDARAKSITVAADLTGADGASCPAQLARVVHSLVENAVRYTPDGGAVMIEASSANGLNVIVQDSGPGLTRGQRRSVFEPFWRADNSRSGPGSGLGLTLALRIAHALGGEIRVSERARGRSTFQVVQPAPD